MAPAPLEAIQDVQQIESIEIEQTRKFHNLHYPTRVQ